MHRENGEEWLATQAETELAAVYGAGLAQLVMAPQRLASSLAPRGSRQTGMRNLAA